MEAVAETDDTLMTKYFDEGELTHDEILSGFGAGMREGSIVPVVACSAVNGIGVTNLLDAISTYLHSPDGVQAFGKSVKTGEPSERVCNDSSPFSAFVFKTIADPFVGKLSLFRVCSGIIASGATLYNSTADKTEKAAGLFVMRGKKQANTTSLHAGDIGAFSKLQFTSTGDTLCDPANPIVYPSIEFPPPCISKAIYASKQGEEDKVFSGLARLQEEDPTIKTEKNTETTETLVSG